MNNITISLIILGIGLLICFFLIIRSKFSQTRKNIEDYQRGRDKLSEKEEEIQEEEDEGGYGLSLGSIIGGFVTILIGASLLSEISSQVQIAQNSTSVLGAADTLLALVPVTFVIMIVISAIGFILMNMRNSGTI